MGSLKSYLMKTFQANLKQRETNRKKRFEIHASDMSNLCLREFLLMYSYGILPEEQNKSYPDYTLLTFRIGNFIEDMVRTLLGGVKPLPVAMKIEDIYLVGSPDIIVADKFIVECKSISRNGFYTLRSPYPEHILQLSFYLWLARRLPDLGWEDRVGAIIYVPKEECRESEEVIKIYEVPLHDKVCDRFDNIVSAIKTYFSDKKIPPKTCKPKNRKKDCRVPELCERLT